MTEAAQVCDRVSMLPSSEFFGMSHTLALEKSLMNKRAALRGLASLALVPPYGMRCAQAQVKPAQIAQIPQIPRSGVLWHAANAKGESPYDENLLDGFQSIGYVDGRVVFEHRFANENPELSAKRLQSSKEMVPACVWVREMLEAGAMMSYGVDQRAIARRTAAYVERILKSEKPADMPVQQPMRFELVFNGKTVKQPGLKIPAAVLISAQEVIA